LRQAPSVTRAGALVPACAITSGEIENAYGFPDKASKATSVVAASRTGDIVRAVVPATSTKAGMYRGRIAIRATSRCNIKTVCGTVQGMHVQDCRPLHRGDGYSYGYTDQKNGGAALPPQP
jgi:hypothetical protein